MEGSIILEQLKNLHVEKNTNQSSIILALLLLLIGVSAAIHQFKVPPIMNQVGEAVGLSADRAPWLMSVFMLVCLIFAIPAGALVQKMQAKQALLLSVALVAAGSIFGAFSSSAVPLLISRGLEGVGFLIISIAIPVAAVTHADPARIGMVMGICGVWISMGSIVAFNTAPALMDHTGWHGVWWVYAAFTIVSMSIFTVTFKGKNNYTKSPGDGVVSEGVPLEDGVVPEGVPLEDGFYSKDITLADTAETNRNTGKQDGGLKEAARNKNLIFASIGFMIYNFTLMSMITFFPVYATGTGLLPLAKASFIASLPMILSLVGSPVIGRLADSFSPKKLYSLTLLCGGIGAALMFSETIPMIIVGAAILGFVGAATPSLMFSSLGKLVPRRELIAPSNGIVVLFQNTGMFLASLLFGTLVNAMEGRFTLTALILIPLAIIAAVLVFLTDFGEKRN